MFENQVMQDLSDNDDSNNSNTSSILLELSGAVSTFPVISTILSGRISDLPGHLMIFQSILDILPEITRQFKITSGSQPSKIANPQEEIDNAPTISSIKYQ